MLIVATHGADEGFVGALGGKADEVHALSKVILIVGALFISDAVLNF